LHRSGKRIEFPRADRFRGDRSDQRARLRRAAEDLTPREERNQADEREAEDPLYSRSPRTTAAAKTMIAAEIERDDLSRSAD